MNEEYKFVGFSTDLELYAEVERYGVELLRGICATLPDSQQWSIVEYMADGGHDEHELVRRRFAVSPETVTVGCHNSCSLKGVRIQIEDPTSDYSERFNKNLDVLFSERPALLNAFMDTFGEEGGSRFSRDLVIICELTKRTEASAIGLICRYLRDGVSYEAMALHTLTISDRETQLLEKWRREQPP